MLVDAHIPAYDESQGGGFVGHRTEVIDCRCGVLGTQNAVVVPGSGPQLIQQHTVNRAPGERFDGVYVGAGTRPAILTGRPRPNHVVHDMDL